MDSIRRLLLGSLYSECKDNPNGITEAQLNRRIDYLKSTHCLSLDTNFNDFIDLCKLKTKEITLSNETQTCLEHAWQETIDFPHLNKHFMNEYKRSKEYQVPANDDEDEIECSVCLSHLDDTDQEPIQLPICNHYVHASCLRRWINTPDQEGNLQLTCPICKRVIDNIQDYVPDFVVDLPPVQLRSYRDWNIYKQRLNHRKTLYEHNLQQTNADDFQPLTENEYIQLVGTDDEKQEYHYYADLWPVRLFNEKVAYIIGDDQLSTSPVYTTIARTIDTDNFRTRSQFIELLQNSTQNFFSESCLRLVFAMDLYQIENNIQDMLELPNLSDELIHILSAYYTYYHNAYTQFVHIVESIHIGPERLSQVDEYEIYRAIYTNNVQYIENIIQQPNVQNTMTACCMRYLFEAHLPSMNAPNNRLSPRMKELILPYSHDIATIHVDPIEIEDQEDIEVNRNLFADFDDE